MVIDWDPWDPLPPAPLPVPIGQEPPMVVVRAHDPRGMTVEVPARDPRTQTVEVSMTLDARRPFNVLLVVLDDVGRDQFETYDAENGWDGSYPYAEMPTVAALANGTYDSSSGGGVRFTRFWAAATCSPFRASALTGLRVHKHRVGVVINDGSPTTLAEILHTPVSGLSGIDADEPRDSAIKTAAFGKWHLGRGDSERSSPRIGGGFRRYVGQLENVNVGPHPNGGTRTWNRPVLTSIALGAATPPPDAAVTQVAYDVGDGRHLEVEEHNAARAYLAGGQGANEPWFVWRTHHFAHRTYSIITGGGGAHVTQSVNVADPVHPGAVDAANYHSFGVRGTSVGDWTGLLNTGGTEVAPMHVYRMMLETADTMLAGLLARIKAQGILDRTVVIVCGDNGTDDLAWDTTNNPDMATYNASGNYASQKAKASMYEGGIGAPLIIWGGADTGIQTSVSHALAEGCDLYATVADCLNRLGATRPDIDGRSLLPILRGQSTTVRPVQYMQRHQPEGARPSEYLTLRSAVRRLDGWKLITQDDGSEELYDTANDPFERVDEVLTQLGIAAELAAYRDARLAEAEAYE